MKIFLGIPSSGTMRTETHQSILGVMYKTPHNFHHSVWNSCYVHDNRHILVKQAVDEKCDYLFFVDTDMIFPEDTVNKMLALDKPVVGVHYNHRHYPLETTVKFANEHGNLIKVKPEDMPQVPFKCFGVATGCMLIKMDVFDKVKPPWWDFEYNLDGSLKTGEDIFFCRKLYKAGIEVWCDPTIQVGHVGEYVY